MQGGINRSDAKIVIKSEGDAQVNGSIIAVSNSIFGDSNSVVSISSDAGGVNVDGSILANSKSFSGNASSGILVLAENDAVVTGNINVNSNTTHGEAFSGIIVGSKNADVDIQGAIAAKAFSKNNSAIADISLFADGDIMLSALVDAPLAQANGAILQQTTTGTDSTASGDASITLDAGGDVRLFDAGGLDQNGFDKNDIHGVTGTIFDPEGYDRFGFNGFGFNRNGIHRDTGTLYGPDGYDENGFDVAGFDREGYDANGFDVAGFDREGYDVNGFDVNGFDINGYDQFGFDINGFNIAGIHRVTGTIFDPLGFDVNGNPAPDAIDLLVSQLEGSDDNQENDGQTDAGLANLEPAAGGNDDCQFMNCDEGSS